MGEEIVSKDLYECAAMVCLGHPVIAIDIQKEGSSSQTIGYFRFERTAELDRSIREYRSFKTLIEPHQLIINVKQLKSSVSAKEKSPR